MTEFTKEQLVYWSQTQPLAAFALAQQERAENAEAEIVNYESWLTTQQAATYAAEAERDRLKGELEAENAKLRACVKAADAYFQADANSVFPVETIYTERQIEESEHWLSVAVKCRDDYYAARAEVDK